MGFKLLAFSDLHADNRLAMCKYDAHGVSDRLHDCCEILHAVWETAKDHEVDAIAFLGDLFERERVDSVTLTEIGRHLHALQEDDPLPLWLVAGNHDLAAKHSEHASVDVLSALGLAGAVVPNYLEPSVTSRPTGGVSFMGLRYERPEQARKRLSEYLDPGTFSGKRKDTVLLMHHDIEGGRVGNWSPPDAIPRELFKGFPLVLSGHYHRPQIITRKGKRLYPEDYPDDLDVEDLKGAVVYLGTPQHLDFGDEGERGVWLFEFEKRKLVEADFIPLATVRFATVRFESKVGPEDVMSKKCNRDQVGHYIRVIPKGPRHAIEALDRDTYEDEIRLACKEQGITVRGFAWEPDIEAHHVARAEVDSSVGLEPLLDAYVNSGAVELGDLDPVELLDYGRKILEEVRS